MFNTTGVMCFFNLWRFLHTTLAGSAAPVWSTWVWLQPLVVVVLSSAPLRFLMWPFASPGWALRDPRKLSLERVTEESWVKQVGFATWTVVAVLVHVAFIAGIRMWGSPRQCAAS